MNNINDITATLLEEINKTEQAVEPFDLAKSTGYIDKFDSFMDAIKYLSDESDIIITKKGKIMSLENAGFTKCKIVSQSLHFAFARKVGTFDDYYIDKTDLKDAMLNDIVLVNGISMRNKGLSAVVYKVVQKGNHTFTGTLVKTMNFLDFKPDAPFRYTIPIKKSIEKPPFKLEENTKIYADVVYDKKQDKFFAVPIKAYGNSQSARICADAIIDANEIITEFSEKALSQAKKIKEAGVSQADIEKRFDLRNELIFTIDGEDAKDLDDAISVKRTKNGYELGVHIADVSHYIREGSTLENEALQRGTSVYFADRVIPMYPEDISNGICSLNANQDKLTFSAIIDLDEKGKMKGYEFKKAVICSKVRGVYSEINKIFDHTADEKIMEKYSIVMDSLNIALELAEKLELLAKSRGTMDLDSKETRFFLDENGKCVDVKPRTTGKAEHLIEQMMITANEAAASYAKNLEIPFVYRIHEKPPLDRLENLSKLASMLGFNTRKLQGDNVRSCDFANLLEQAKDSQYKTIINHQILRSMAKARYDTNPVGHFGLSLDDYCHFTSPIRRFPDTAIHRILSAVVEGKHPSQIIKYYTAFANEVATHCSETEIKAMTAERSAEKCYMAEYILQYKGETFDGVVSGVTQYGVYVELENTCEGFVRAEFLPSMMDYDGSVSYINRGKGENITIGTKMKITVYTADVATGMIDFMPVNKQERREKRK